MTTLAEKAILSGAENRIPMLEKDIDTIQADCDVKATNIILQGLPLKERECKLYDEFDKFSYKKGKHYVTLLEIFTVHHNVYSPPQSISQLEYPLAVNLQPQQAEFPRLDSGLTVLVFKKGDDPIDAINHMMSFLSAVVTSRYPTTNN
nr:hypothetical protein [Tanacetum cinerariifolium]